MLLFSFGSGTQASLLSFVGRTVPGGEFTLERVASVVRVLHTLIRYTYSQRPWCAHSHDLSANARQVCSQSWEWSGAICGVALLGHAVAQNGVPVLVAGPTDLADHIQVPVHIRS